LESCLLSCRISRRRSNAHSPSPPLSPSLLCQPVPPIPTSFRQSGERKRAALEAIKQTGCSSLFLPQLYKPYGGKDVSSSSLALNISSLQISNAILLFKIPRQYSRESLRLFLYRFCRRVSFHRLRSILSENTLLLSLSMATCLPENTSFLERWIFQSCIKAPPIGPHDLTPFPFSGTEIHADIFRHMDRSQ